VSAVFRITTKLDFVNLGGITDSANQALKKSGGDFNYLVFWLIIGKVACATANQN
jgi:hypothetical protein